MGDGAIMAGGKESEETQDDSWDYVIEILSPFMGVTVEVFQLHNLSG